MRINSTERTANRRALDTSFAGATKIVVAVNRLTGLRPLHYSDAKFWMLLNYSYRMILVTTVGYFMYWIYVCRLLHIHIKRDRMVYLSLRIVNFLSFVCIQFLGCYHSDQIPGLRRRIAVLEDSLAKLGAVADNRNIFLWIVCSYTTSILHTLIVFGVLGCWMWSPIFVTHRLFFSFIANIGSQVLLDFLTYACWLKCSFRQTNDLLKELLAESRWIKTGDSSDEVTEDKSDRGNVQRDQNKWMSEHLSLRRIRVAPFDKISSVKHELQAVKKVHMLHEIRGIHLHLCRIIKTLNRTYDAQITIYSFVLVTNFVIILYNVYGELKKFDEDPKGLLSTAVPILDILYTCVKIAVTCYVCEGTAREMKKVVEIVHKWSVSNLNVELKDEIWQFSLQLSLNRVCNTEIDSFRLSFSHIRQCASCITAYLVILIQWAQSIRPDYLLGLNATESFQAQFNPTKRD